VISNDDSANVWIEDAVLSTCKQQQLAHLLSKEKVLPPHITSISRTIHLSNNALAHSSYSLPINKVKKTRLSLRWDYPEIRFNGYDLSRIDTHHTYHSPSHALSFVIANKKRKRAGGENSG